MFLLLSILLTTMVSVISDDDDDQVLTILIWLERPEKQVIIDEIIRALEECDLEVNTLYMPTLEAWQDYEGDYDLWYGGIQELPRDGDIFMYAFINYLLYEFIMMYEDAKISKNVGKLWDMYLEAIDDPDVVDEAFIDDMVDAFQDIEERLWEKQYLIVFNRWLEPSSDIWGPVPTMNTETLGYNCLPGNVFADPKLRLELNEEIDRDVFLDYHSSYNPYSTYEVYHVFQWLPFHDTSLPNEYPDA